MPRLARLTTLAASLTATAALLTACVPGGTPLAPPPPSGQPPASTSPSTPTQPGAPVIDTLKRVADPNTFLGVLAGADGTTATEYSIPGLTGWTVYDLQNRRTPHPQRLYVALSDADEVLVLSGQPANFATVSTMAPVANAPAAERRASDYLELTRVMSKVAYEITGVDDIKWLPKPTAEQEAAKASLSKQYRDQVKPATASPTLAGDRWLVTVWRVEEQSLVKHEVTVGSDGSVADKPTEVEKGLPTPVAG